MTSLGVSDQASEWMERQRVCSRQRQAGNGVRVDWRVAVVRRFGLGIVAVLLVV